ncbi:MAG TPA: ATP-dependent Clp protease adaptor ClpS [Thermoanaerobaculia bacterium]|nr:ATP-dependent Clp protease adaptor ClpS [Thermoanaerobaculia bacterium]
MARFDDDRHGEGAGKVLTRTQTRTALKRPRMYKVLLHNDDYTPREFVVLVLQHVFVMSEAEASRLMLHVHNHGVGVAGIYPFSVAETKVAEVGAAAEKAKFPLMATLEPESDGDEDDGEQGGNDGGWTHGGPPS